MGRLLCFILASALLGAAAPSVRAAPPPVDVFIQDFNVGGMDLSPNGRYLARVRKLKNKKHMREVAVLEVTENGLKPYKSFTIENVYILDLNWASNKRLLITIQIYDPKTGSPLTILPGGRKYKWRPPQIVATDTDLTHEVVLLKEEKDFKMTGDKSEVLHWLPNDPDHILMELYDSRAWTSLNVYKVNVYSGKAELVEQGKAHTVAWMVDGEGNVRMRIDRRYGYTLMFARSSPGEDWFKIASFRPREKPDIFPFAFSSRPDVVYVGSYHENDRMAVYEYNMKTRVRGKLVFVHPKVDVTGPVFTVKGNRLVGFRYVLDKPKTHFNVPEFGKFERTLEESFGAENYARPVTSARNSNLMIIRVTGPRNPGTYYLYNAATQKSELIGMNVEEVDPDAMGRMRPASYKARDGLEISAYLTLPPGQVSKPPLVVMPHGGPEVRDFLDWNPWVQFLATRGYAVLQPNFRGSDGYGRKFTEAGYKQWGLKMQDDITDGVRHVVAQGLVDGDRVCIFGASYGGYAALAGAAFTPELYKCAISVNGLSDLYAYMRREVRRRWEFHYWKKSIGRLDDRADKARMKRRSPINAVASIRIPILLMAGEKDDTVPVEQSRDMAKALKQAGKPHRYIEFKDEKHSFKEFANRKKMLLEAEKFLARHIGPARQPAPVAPAQ